MTHLGEIGSGADQGALWPPSAPERLVLSARRFRTAAAFAAALLGSADHPMVMAPWEVALKLDRFLHALRSPRRWHVLMALTVLEWRPLLSLAPPLSRMSPARRRRYLARRLPSHRGMLGKSAAIKSLLYLVYYGDERANAITGFTTVPERVEARATDTDARVLPTAPISARKTGS